MAEYKKFSCPYGDDFEGGEVCDRCDKYEICMETPTADVIERSEIDKAIKEMERYSTSFEYANRHDLADAVDYCIGVIQRNIGE